tara:strand:+ start:736 stop:1494 length:759 start_codon:yes stop_codon:yes gene_type:complete
MSYLKSLFFSVIFLSTSVVFGQVLTAKEIIKKSEDKIRGGNQAYTEMTIEIIRPKWSREMKLKSWALGADYSMILITGPARDKGSVFLKNQKQVWGYIPKFNRITKLPPAVMSQSWMGTDLTNDDLVRESNKVDDFKYFLKPDTMIDNLSCYQIELIPNEGTNVIWGKIILFIDKVDFITLRNESYDEDNQLVNVLKASVIKIMDGVKMATKMEIIPMEEKGKKTIMTIEKLDTHQSLDATFYSKQNMKRVK